MVMLVLEIFNKNLCSRNLTDKLQAVDLVSSCVATINIKTFSSYNVKHICLQGCHDNVATNSVHLISMLAKEKYKFLFS